MLTLNRSKLQITVILIKHLTLEHHLNKKLLIEAMTPLELCLARSPSVKIARLRYESLRTRVLSR